MLGLRDYVDINELPDVVLGLSGGVDSALVAALSADAPGARARALRDAAFTATPPAREPGPMRPTAPRRWACATTSVPIAAAVNGFEAPVKNVRRAAARHHRRKSAGAHPGHALMATLQQDRRHGGDHRQQVRNVGRLRHALR